MGGLGAIAAIGARIHRMRALPPIDWCLSPAEPSAMVGFEAGIAWAITRRDGRVDFSAAAEAGALLLASLTPDDAMTVAGLCGVGEGA